MLLSATHVKWCLSSQTLVYNSAYAPQISFSIIVLGHDDLGSLCADKHSLQIREMVTLLAQETRVREFNSHHVHGRATQCGCHSVCLEMTCKPKVSWRVREVRSGVFSSICVCIMHPHRHTIHSGLLVLQLLSLPNHYLS